MGEVNWKRVAVLILCVGFSNLLAAAIRNAAHGATKDVDFAAIYIGARCTMRHEDPYNGQARLREFAAAGGKFLSSNTQEARGARTVMAVEVNLPTAFFVAAPFAMLSWPVAQFIWLGLVTGVLVLAALLMWDLGAGAAPVLSGWIACFVLLNCELVLALGNLAGVSVPLCVVAAWCFLKRRYELAGVALLALSLVMKPHDAGFVWLYFLLAGGTGRKRALQTLAVTAALGICTAIWIAPASPHWTQELRSNIAADAAPGGLNDPGPSGQSYGTMFESIQLQTAVSVFKNDASFYNPVSFAIGGGLILAWAIAVLRKRSTGEGALIALAAVSLLTMLPVYHRTHDAKLLLLTIPALAMLWAGKRPRRAVALGLTWAAVVATSDLPLILWTAVASKLAVSTSTLAGKWETLLFWPAPVMLLAAGAYYLWEYIRYHPSPAEPTRVNEAAGRAAASAAG